MTLKEGSNQIYEIKKVFNNNVVLAIKKNNYNQTNEVILLGKGLGFAKNQGDILSSDKCNIEKEFIPVNEEKKEQYQQLVENVNEEIIGLTTEIIAMVSNELNEELDKHIHIALADHIAFALKRIKEGMDIVNPFLPETKTLYYKEYNLAKRAAKMIEERSGVPIPESEVGFITFHIHGARSNRGRSRAVKYTSLIKKMINVIEKELDIELTSESLNYARLVTHLRFALERIEENKTNQNPLLEKIKNDLNFSYQVADKLSLMIYEELELKVPEDEKGYLAMHLERLKKNLI
ncbi:glucose PTS transporter transcription antiterminator GlcT [Orenia marismortui]|uniref:glucose PTS transporter transcription antiterminator GlcT n=1 Tax=Orenia marismortui TaxID=46469 RepID=UPI00035E6494|nr:PRD domain-containing protein [Orenia marismortui]